MGLYHSNLVRVVKKHGGVSKKALRCNFALQ